MTSDAAGQAGLDEDLITPPLAGERTAFAWARSAMNLAASGTLLARAALVAHLDVLGVLFAFGMATVALFAWRHARFAGGERTEAGGPGRPRPGALAVLTAVTVLTAVAALVVTVAI